MITLIPKILIVEDEMIIGAKISMYITNMGYEVIGLLAKGEEALVHIRSNRPDIILLDIRLKGELDGIETAQEMQLEYDIPVIYITANSDDVHFNRAKSTRPQAFISKPVKRLDLHRAIELTLARLEHEQKEILHYEEIPLPATEAQKWLAVLETTIRDHIASQQLTVDFLAEALHMSRAQLFRKVQSVAGMTPLQYIQEIRYDHARTLLEQRKINNVKTVAAAIGIQKVQYFSVQFKLRFGKLPSEYLE